jgi:hypothetical protein
MTRKKKIKRVIYYSLITILVFVIGLATIILYPQPLFAKKIAYKQFNVYSNEKIEDDIKRILDSALSLVEESELYDSTYKMDIFLAYNTFFNKLDDQIFRQGSSARAIDNNLVIKVKIDVNKNLAFTIFHNPCQQSFAYLIAHEMVHCLQAHKYGIWKFNPIRHPALWKLEGYPEYVARQKSADPNYSLKREIKRFIELKRTQTDKWISVEERGCQTPEFYYKGRLMTEYLINVRELTYDQVLKDKHSEDEIYAEMIEWANK